MVYLSLLAHILVLAISVILGKICLQSLLHLPSFYNLFDSLEVSTSGLLSVYSLVVLQILSFSLMKMVLLILLCNVRKMIEQIIVCNRVKDDFNIFQLRPILFLFCLYLCRENNHDCLGVMQFLYYKSSSKRVLKSVRVWFRHRNRERQIQTNKEEHYNINKE